MKPSTQEPSKNEVVEQRENVSSTPAEPNVASKPFFEDLRSRPLFEKLLFLFAIVAIGLGVPPYLKEINPENESVCALYFVIQNGAIIFLLIGWLCIFYARLERLRRNAQNQQAELAVTISGLQSALAVAFNEFHVINEAKRELMNQQTHAPRQFVAKDAVDTMIRLCDSLKRMFEALFPDDPNHATSPFHVAIKVINGSSETGRLWGVCVARDTAMCHSEHHRNFDQHHFELLKNTDYDLLLKQHQSAWGSDDLTSLCDAGVYSNTSPGWRERYNRTIVVPIRNGSINGKASELVGFLAIDIKSTAPELMLCRRDGKPREELVALMLAYADSLFAILKRGTIAAKSDQLHPTQTDYNIDQSNFDFIKELHSEFCRSAGRNVTPD